jgi:glycosyltransferase involved in cell wall biosynthesis
MRIALVTSALPADTRGGAEKYVEDAARSLAERHDVVVFTGSRRELDGIRLVRLPGLAYHDAGAGSATSRLLWHARDLWRPSVHVVFGRALDREAPDVVWTHQPQGLSAAVFTALAARKAAHVHTAHDLNLMCARTSMTRGGVYCGGHCIGCLPQRQTRGRAIGRRLDRFIGVSRYITSRHVSEGIVPAAKAVTIRVGATSAPSRARLVTGSPTIGFIGAVAEHKGIRTLLRTWAGAPPNWGLLVAGTGPVAGEVEAAAASDERIEYLGYVADEEKNAFYDRVDLVVIPSEWEEPGPFVAVEAAVRGIPCVVSNRGGLPEVPEARTFTSGDPDSLRDTLAWFLETPQRVATASENLAAAHDEFTWPTHLARVEALLAQVVAEAAEPTSPRAL